MISRFDVIPRYEVLVRIAGVERYRARYETWRASEDDYADCLRAAMIDAKAGLETGGVEVVKLANGEFAARWSSDRYLAIVEGR